MLELYIALLNFKERCRVYYKKKSKFTFIDNIICTVSSILVDPKVQG